MAGWEDGGAGMRKQRAAPCQCAVLGCGASVPPLQLLCGAHWKALPPDLRDAIVAAGRNTLARARARGEALKWYAERTNRAKAAISTHCRRPEQPAGLPYRED